MDIIDNYAAEHTSAEGDVLERLIRETNLKVLMPRMLSGRVQGKLLEMTCRLMNAKNVLEIGTFTGYSAICIANGLSSDGRVYTIDKNAELKHFLKKYAAEAGVQDKIVQITGDAMIEINRLNIEFDMAFIDADKENYINYYNMILPKIRKGGLIIADNVLWGGKVVQPVRKGDKDTIAILSFNKMVQDDPRVENVLLPFRDGVMMIRKL